MLGSLGSIVFEAADSHILTFSDLSFTRSANYTEHKIIGKSGILEFTGLNAGACSIKMVFDATLGINPKEQLEEIERMMQEHEANLFVLDGQLVGSGYWVIESLNETMEFIDNFGGAHRISVDVSLKEYVK